MLLKSPLRGALLGVIINQVDAQDSKCFSTSAVGEINYDACCSGGETSGKGAINGVVFDYICDKFAAKLGMYPGGTFSTAKNCAQAIAADPKWNSGVWESDEADCSVFESITPILSSGKGFLFIRKTPDAPETADLKVECKDLVDTAKGAVESKCATEKNQLVQEGLQEREQERVDCQIEKDKSIAAAKSECDSAHENLRAEAKTQVEKAQVQYDTEKNELREKCQNDKETAVAAAVATAAATAKDQCDTDKNKLGEKCQSDKETAVAAAVAAAKDQCDTDKNQLRKEGVDNLQQRESQCEARISALEKANGNVDEASKQCETDKNKLLQETTNIKTICDADKAALLGQIEELEKKVSTGGSKDGETNKGLSTSAQDPGCIYRNNMCGGCGHDTFTVEGVEWKKKCGVRTWGGREAVYYGNTLVDCMKQCSLDNNCLGIGWRATENYCHAHMSLGGGLNTKYVPTEHLVWMPSRVNPIHR
ncbi:hypothetical protein ACHAO1_009672 [Botrytis cinerea]